MPGDRNSSIDGIRGRRVITAGRQDSARRTLAQRLTLAGAVIIEVGDPASALSAAAGASSAGDPVAMIALAGEGLNAADWELFDRVAVLFGSPRIPLIVIGGQDCPLPLARHLTGIVSDEALAAAVSSAIAHPDQPAPTVTAAATPVAADGDAAVGGLASKRILLAEDNEVNQLVAVGMLSSLGCVAEVVVNGQEAVAALSKNDFDLVLMDVRMPVMDGLEATRQIRAMEGAKGRIPIIAVTANAMRGDQEACIAAGMNDYLAKPIRLATLEVALKRWLE